MAKREKKRSNKVETMENVKQESPFIEIESKVTLNVVLVHDIFCKANGKCTCKRVKHFPSHVEHVSVGKVKAVDVKRGKGHTVVIPSSYTIVPGRQKVRKALLTLPAVQRAVSHGMIKVLGK